MPVPFTYRTRKTASKFRKVPGGSHISVLRIKLIAPLEISCIPQIMVTSKSPQPGAAPTTPELSADHR
jgi:hypothetical protein